MKLLAVTFNFIGPNAAQSIPNKEIAIGDNVVIPISGEWFLKDYPIERQEDSIQIIRPYLLEQLYTKELLCIQEPEIVLVYVGMGHDGDVTWAMNFANIAAKRIPSVQEVHIVWPVEITRRSLLYRELSDWTKDNKRIPIVHFAESTGNLTMHRLVMEFINNGKIKDPAEYRLRG